jgi:hypothetical protein
MAQRRGRAHIVLSSARFQAGRTVSPSHTKFRQESSVTG